MFGKEWSCQMRLNLLDVSPMLFKLAGSKNLSNFNRQGSSKSEMEIAESEVETAEFEDETAGMVGKVFIRPDQ